MATLAIAALLPQPWKGRLATHGLLHAGTHVVAFSAAFLLNTRVRTRVARTALLLLLLGIALEAMQTRVYGNLFEFGDVAADAAGVAVGLLVRGLWQIIIAKGGACFSLR